MKFNGSSVPDRLSRLMKTIVGSLPIKDPHSEKRKKRRIVDLRTINHSEPFSPLDHVRPQAVVKEEIRENVIPPAMVCSHLVLPLFDNPMKGILGNLEDPSVFLQTRNEKGAYLESCQIMSPT